MPLKISRTALAIIYLSLILVPGCATPPAKRYERTAPFNETEYAPFAQAGSATITGQAFLKTRGGDVKLGAGDTVYLNPVTTYSIEWFNVNAISQLPITEGDPRAAKYHKQTVADGSGHFKFSNLAPGEYFLTCTITWEVPTGYGIAKTGGTTYARVKVAAGENAEAVLQRP